MVLGELKEGDIQVVEEQGKIRGFQDIQVVRLESEVGERGYIGFREGCGQGLGLSFYYLVFRIGYVGILVGGKEGSQVYEYFYWILVGEGLVWVGGGVQSQQ